MTGVLLDCLPVFVEGLQFLIGADLRTDPRVVSHPPRAKVSTIAGELAQLLITLGNRTSPPSNVGTNGPGEQFNS